MNTTSQYSKSFYKLLYASLIVCSLNGILQCIVFFTKKRVTELDQFGLVLWIIVPIALLFMIYHSKKTIPISYSDDGIKYKQGVIDKFIPIDQIADVVTDENGVTIFGRNKSVIKKFKSKQYQDLSFLEQRFRQHLLINSVKS